MENPLRGIYLNNRYYPYAHDTFRESMKLKNNMSETQSSRNFSTAGGSASTFTLTLFLENTVQIQHGTSFVGTTAWLGISQLSDMKAYIGSGSSMPITFVSPYGVTYSVVPVGEIDISERVTVARETGMEFRVDLTLESI